MDSNTFVLTDSQQLSFAKNGYLVVKQWLVGDEFLSVKAVADTQFQHPTEPWELESELGYPGAPKGIDQEGGRTIRRLKAAYQRDQCWQNYATSKRMKAPLQQLFCCPDIFLSQAHHNCLMTKSPRFSSDTGWHQDSRYWHFEKPELITAWLALGAERAENGALQVIPGSHRQPLDCEFFDDKKFFLADKAKQSGFAKKSIDIELDAGDLLFFHCNLLHRAARNVSERSKLSLVFTYHSGENSAVKNTRSSAQQAIPL